MATRNLTGKAWSFRLGRGDLPSQLEIEYRKRENKSERVFFLLPDLAGAALLLLLAHPRPRKSRRFLLDRIPSASARAIGLYWHS